MESRSTVSYSNPKLSADIVAAAFPAIASSYATLDALKAAIGAAGVVIETPSDIPDPIRYGLSVGIVGNAGQIPQERTYVVRRMNLDGTEGFLVELVGTTLWTASANAIVGGRANHKMPSGAAFTTTGVLEARTGKAPVAINQEPASLQIYDVGPICAIARVFIKGTATSVAPIHDAWR